MTSTPLASPCAEPASLAMHLLHCARSRGRLHRLRLAAEAVHGAVAPRFVSSLVLLAGLAGAVAWLVA